MTGAIHLCPHCRHYCQPTRPSAFAPGAVRTARQFDIATRELTDLERHEEEARVSDQLPFDSPPQFFPWCTKFTLSEEEIDELNRRQRAGDHRLARSIMDAGYASLDGTRGVLVRLYALCLRRNPAPYECSGFKALP
jgi:hypothetical protein